MAKILTPQCICVCKGIFAFIRLLACKAETQEQLLQRQASEWKAMKAQVALLKKDARGVLEGDEPNETCSLSPDHPVGSTLNTVSESTVSN